ncbi:MAG: DUF2608 domain-containing protein [Chlamydiales bacterium]
MAINTSTFNLIETNQIQRVSTLVTESCANGNDPLVLFNISDVCFQHIYTVQEDKWRSAMATRVEQIFPDDSERAKKVICACRSLVVNHLPQRHVDERTPQVIADLQAQGVSVIGISGRSARAAYALNGDNALLTNKYLQSVGIDFSQSTFVQEASGKVINEEGKPSFHHGILFTAGKPSAEADLNNPSSSEVLQNFLTTIDSKAKSILVINNSATSLRKMGEKLIQKGFEVTGVHYTATAERKKAIDHSIGYIQFLQLAEKMDVSGDDVATEMLMQNEDKEHYQKLFDDYIRNLEM